MSEHEAAQEINEHCMSIIINSNQYYLPVLPRPSHAKGDGGTPCTLGAGKVKKIRIVSMSKVKGPNAEQPR